MRADMGEKSNSDSINIAVYPTLSTDTDTFYTDCGDSGGKVFIG